jgi:SAUR family protein
MRSMRNEITKVLPLKNLSRRCQGIASARKSLPFKLWRCITLDSEIAEENLDIPSDVPVGHNPVYVGSERRRFIIPTTYLNHPLSRELLQKAEEEFGFDHQMGLLIPCEEVTFEYLTSIMAG